MSRSTNPKKAVKHRIAKYNNRLSVRVSSAQSKVLTSKRFQIRCKGAANEEGEGKKLLGDKDRIEHLIASHTLASKRALASDHSGEWASLRREHPILSRPSFRILHHNIGLGHSPMRKTLQLQNVSTKPDGQKAAKTYT
jgi:hypothetical protein